MALARFQSIISPHSEDVDLSEAHWAHWRKAYLEPPIKSDVTMQLDAGCRNPVLVRTLDAEPGQADGVTQVVGADSNERFGERRLSCDDSS
jgi:hypothetical protein